MTKYKLNSEQLDKLIFPYLNSTLGGLEKGNLSRMDYWILPDEDNPTFTLTRTGPASNPNAGINRLGINYELVSFVKNLYSINAETAMDTITRWFKHTYKQNTHDTHLII